MPTELTVRDRYKPEKILETWVTMMRSLTKMTEDEMNAALQYELSHDRRRDVILRIHRKFTRIRKERELKEYLENAK